MSKKPKTRNLNTMTEAAFIAMLRSALRKRSMYWKPINEVKKLNRRESLNTNNKRQKWEYQCSCCKEWFSGKEVEVDHIEGIPSLKDVNDFPEFINGLFCEIDKLQLLCKTCHSNKTYGR